MSTSFAELTSLYRNNKKAPSALDDKSVLPGTTVYEKLNKLNFNRKSNSQFASAGDLSSQTTFIMKLYGKPGSKKVKLVSSTSQKSLFTQSILIELNLNGSESD